MPQIRWVPKAKVVKLTVFIQLILGIQFVLSICRNAVDPGRHVQLLATPVFSSMQNIDLAAEYLISQQPMD
ncbi:hypothetical protein OS493_017051 [Desmophyllum pertusum]|uniref:Uncharacterized protein n=1 Tax=Desmophyllum pertusum TaxID=174260 RepID=A0A9W9YCA5_9CNID|nr:hypothetical protein OS493_017051 [Desmophyllum pertusum]